MKTILIVDDENDIRLSLGGILKDEGYTILEANSLTSALECLETNLPDLIFLDLWLDEPEDGFEVLKKIQADSLDIPTVVISGHGTVETAVKTVKLGAFDFIEKPLSYEKIILVVDRAFKFQRLSEENKLLKIKHSGNFELLGKSAVMLNLKDQIKMVAASSASVLITGENGTGKELVAQTIHRLSLRREKNLIEVNCAAIPEELIESELFGHEKGAFTGAIERRRGRFDLANNSTLFLDEIGDMSLKTQAKILRILQEQKFERVGGVKTININVRVVAATNKNLEEEIKEGRFREDLYYRLNVVPLEVPPLRARGDDIKLLAFKFLKDYCQSHGIQQKCLSENVLKKFAQHPWPGNVRELKNIIERLVIMTPGKYIEDLIEPKITSIEGHNVNLYPFEINDLNFKEAKIAFERFYLSHNLVKYNNNVSQTAEAIKVDRTNLHRKLKILGIEN